MRKIFASVISFYQKYLSPLKRRTCVFYPTCSAYAKEAILKYGIWKGGRLSLKRIFSCHPWQKNHIDPVK